MNLKSTCSQKIALEELSYNILKKCDNLLSSQLLSLQENEA